MGVFVLSICLFPISNIRGILVLSRPLVPNHFMLSNKLFYIMTSCRRGKILDFMRLSGTFYDNIAVNPLLAMEA